MDFDHIQIDMINPFNKRIVFVFNMKICLTHLTRLTYKVISYFDIIV